MSERGVIRNRQFAAQIRNFSGLRFGNITPTDIDGLIEYRGKAFVFIEAKFGDSMPPHGQMLALERLCDTCEKAGKPSIVFIARHTQQGDIDFAALDVVKVRKAGIWKDPNRPVKLREAIDFFLRQVEGRGTP